MFLVIIFLVSSLLTQARVERSKLSFPEAREPLTLFNAILATRTNVKNKGTLQEIKFYILSGNLEQAKIMLNQADISINLNKSIQYRYLAMIHFIEKNYTLALKYLNKPELLEINNQARTCFLRVLTYIIIDRPNIATNAWKSCREAASIYSSSDLAWMQVIVDLKTKKDQQYINKLFEQLSVQNLDAKYLRLYMKLALYLNKESQVIPSFKFLSKKVLTDDNLRELIGINYYRDGQVEKAYRVLENLDTANAEVFKGNIYLFQQKYDLAYAQFKLALKRKSNSLNAIERLLPVSWKLKQYDEGVQFLQRVEVPNSKKIENYTTMAAFLTMQNKHRAARNYLNFVMENSNQGQPIEVNQLNVLNSIYAQDDTNVESSAANNCSKRDGIHCWYIIATNVWESLFENFSRDEKIHDGSIDLVDYYTKVEPEQLGIKENSLIEQKYIEELDNNLIKIVVPE